VRAPEFAGRDTRHHQFGVHGFYATKVISRQCASRPFHCSTAQRWIRVATQPIWGFQRISRSKCKSRFGHFAPRVALRWGCR